MAFPWATLAGQAIGSGGGLSLDTSSRSSIGPAQFGAPVINVAGFGGRASGSATQSGNFPTTPGDVPAAPAPAIAGAGLPQWAAPLGILAAFALVAFAVKKG